MYILKYIRDNKLDEKLANPRIIDKILKLIGVGFDSKPLTALLRYVILRGVGMQGNAIFLDRVINKLPEETRTEMTTIAEPWREEGRKKVLEEGVLIGVQKCLEQGSRQKATDLAKRLLDAGMAIVKVAKLTDLSPEAVENLRSYH